MSVIPMQVMSGMHLGDSCFASALRVAEAGRGSAATARLRHDCGA